MKITDFFDKTFCTNFDRRFDRRSECVAEFDKNKLVDIENKMSDYKWLIK